MFALDQKRGRVEVRFDDQVILRFVDRHLMFRQFRAGEMRMRPGGPIEVLGLFASSFYGSDLLAARVECRQLGAHHVRLVLTPTVVDKGLDRYVRETRTFDIHYLPDRDRFRYDVTVRLAFERDVRGDEGLHHTYMTQWGDDDFAVVEFDDPALNGGVGPQVPMTQEWEGLSEPCLAEDCFQTTWTKRYLSVVLNTAERGPRRLVFNRTVNSVQQYYNRHVLRTASREPYYYQKADGRYLVYTPRFDWPAGHHICEWGYDMHLYALLPKAGPRTLFAAGQDIELAYSYEEVEADEVPAAYRDAREAGIDETERSLSDRPIYEEPVCRFVDSALDHPDSYAWEPDGSCHWDRAGGNDEGLGALRIAHGDRPAQSSWSFPYFGPSYATNPIPPLSRLRVRALCRAAEPEHLALEFTTHSYAGPAMVSPRRPHTTTGRGDQATPAAGGWRVLEFITPKCGSYVLSGEIHFRYTGRGDASVAELSVAPAQQIALSYTGSEGTHACPGHVGSNSRGFRARESAAREGSVVGLMGSDEP